MTFYFKNQQLKQTPCTLDIQTYGVATYGIEQANVREGRMQLPFTHVRLR